MACTVAMNLFGQTYNMSNTTINTCSGSFYDSGGSFGPYANNQSLTMTFCSSAPGANIVMDFTSFVLESGFDFLTIHDGPNSSSPLIGVFSGGTTPGVITSTNGCLTFVFDSDFSVTQVGWTANISCTVPCQDVVASTVFNPAPNGDGIVYLCQGEPLTMDGITSYPNNGAEYTQSDASSTFEWNTQDGSNDIGQNATHIFNSAGAYIVELVVTDVNGCESNNPSQLVYVGTNPIFSSSPSNPSVLCQGTQATLFGIANEVEFSQSCTTPPPPYLPLPDGSGASYSTSIDIQCYAPSELIDDLSDLSNICINMEHSYSGDLDIEIVCPNGQSTFLFDQANGPAIWGEPVAMNLPIDSDTDNPTPGIGYDYCFNPSATLLPTGIPIGTYTDPIGQVSYNVSQIPAGNYDIVGNWNNLLGCPINGEWELIVTDNFLADNGTIFNWSIDFNLPTITTASFTPNIVSTSWQADPSIIAGSNPIIIQPASSGNLCFNYEVTDDFGCTYDTSYCIDVLPASSSIDAQNSCGNFTWIDGNTYNSNNNSATWILTNSLGCDSTVTLDLTIDSNTGNDIQTHCDSYTWIDGITYTSSNNSATWVLTNQAGCDSTVTLDLSITNSTTAIDIQEACDSYTWIDGNTYTSSNNSATWLTTNSIGCDSTVILDLTITNSNNGIDTQAHCDSYTWIDGNTYTSSNNTATWILTNAVGCDSTVTLDLNITNSTTGNDIQTHCDSYTWIDGNNYTTSNNSATWILTNSAGCDSLVTLDLTITNSTFGTDSHISCDSYTWIDGITYTENNNTATWIMTNAAGCDSIITLDLTITNSNTGTDTQVACDTYTWIDGNSYTSNNNSATWILTNTSGCDSTVILDLTIISSNTGTDLQTACDSYTWIDGNNYTTNNNTATWVLTNVDGCDSTVTLDLNILSSTSGIDSQVSCDSYNWIDGNTYTASNNSATWILINSEGCDSIVTLDLIITNSTNGLDTQLACDSYSWIDGNTYTESNNSATWILTNTSGCDSTVTLDLTITDSNYGSDIQTHCDSYTWIDGNTYTESNNSATWVLTNSAGCDSTVALDLTITNSNAGTDIQTFCDSYTWIDGNVYTESNNTATWILTNSSGCDSTVTLDLTITNSNTGIDTQVACDSYTWIDGNTYTSSNNTATWVLTNTSGCDSIVSLDLTIHYTPNFTLSGTDPSVCNAFDGNILISDLSPNMSYFFNYDSLSNLSQSLNATSNSAGEILLSNLGAGLYTDFSLSNEGCSFSSSQIIDLNNPGAPAIDNQLDTTVCDVFVLLNISGTNLSGDQSYYTEIDAQGSPLSVGDTITETQTIYLYDITGLCADQSNFTVTVDNTPALVNPGPQEACESYSLPLSIVGTNLSGSQNYYNDSQGNGGEVVSSALSSSQIIYIYDSDGLCSDEVSFQVTVYNNPELLSFSGGDIYCEGEIIQPLTAQVQGLPGFVMEYTVDDVNASISSSDGLFNFGNEAGEYLLTVLSDNHCSTFLNESQSIVINTLPQPPIISNEYNYCINDIPEPIIANGSSGDYNWFTDASLTDFIASGESLIPSIISGDTYYYVLAIENDCEGLPSNTVVSFEICDITIPTAFTPDNDLVNDFWELVNIDLVYPSNTVQVYNRWGTKIYQSNEGGYNLTPWDGRYQGEALPIGSYYYIINYNDGKTDSTTGIVSIIK